MNNITNHPLTSWLAENGPSQLEALLRAIIFQPSQAILIADDERNYKDASTGAARFLGQRRQQIIGRRVEDFAAPAFGATFSKRWKEFLVEGNQVGTLPLLDREGALREVDYGAKFNLLPVRHLLVLRDKASPKAKESLNRSQSWDEDYGLLLLDASGSIFAFYAGAERIYGHKQEEVIGKEISLLYRQNESLGNYLRGERKRVFDKGYASSEGWHVRKDGSRFWANVITIALRDDLGVLRGFASVIRDFSDRRERDEKLGKNRPRRRALNDKTSVVGVVSGEYDRITEINDALLEIIGYDREDLVTGRLNWPDLNPEDFSEQDAFSHEQGLHFGACSPVEKELLRKDGTRVPVLVATAVLKLVPYQWITFVTDLRSRNLLEDVDYDPSTSPPEFSGIIGTSKELQVCLAQVELVAPTDATVLILGETGTGKERIARAIHELSPRKKFPFISLNCAAIPSGLLESELFGYERGAFTGAMQRKFGRFEMANRGTLFLDEVGDIPLELQPKLLRALQEMVVERLGSTQATPIDVRLVAATNRNLKQMMTDNLFRGDLYYRLKVFPINLPLLRDRQGDIPLLVKHFMKKYSDKMGRNVQRVSPHVMDQICKWSWPGNIRELENFIEKSVILSPGDTLCAPVSELSDDEEAKAGHFPAPPAGSSLEDVERAHIVRVLGETGGVVTEAAKRLRIPRTTLNSLIRKFRIERNKAFHTTSI